MEDKNTLVLVFKKFLRFKDSIKWSMISFLGFILGLNTLSIKPNLIAFIVFISSTFFIMSFTFAINNFYDVETDKINPRRQKINAIASGQLSKKISIIILMFLVIAPLLISISYGLNLFFFCAFLLFLGWAYSAPPLRTKNVPVVDVIWHFVGFFSYIVWGSLISGSINTFVLFMAISIGIFSSIGQIGNHINDYKSDKESGTITFAVWAGLDKSKSSLKIVTFLHLIFLLPLVLFYSINNYISIFVLCFITIIGLILLRPKRGAFPSNRCFIYFFTIVIGGAVYLSCLIYHILSLIDFATIYIIQIGIG